MVGRGGLEPSTSAVTGPERCAYDLPELDRDERCSRCYLYGTIPTRLADMQRQEVATSAVSPGSDAAEVRYLEEGHARGKGVINISVWFIAQITPGPRMRA